MSVLHGRITYWNTIGLYGNCMNSPGGRIPYHDSVVPWETLFHGIVRQMKRSDISQRLLRVRLSVR